VGEFVVGEVVRRVEVVGVVVLDVAVESVVREELAGHKAVDPWTCPPRASAFPTQILR
jgi:hypothetical protein